MTGLNHKLISGWTAIFITISGPLSFYSAASAQSSLPQIDLRRTPTVRPSRRLPNPVISEIARQRVDLRNQQTPIRSQGNRRSCITFAATAAVEAALKRAGHGSIDLSEDFFQYMIKTFWLHNWDTISDASAQETQLGFTAGGNGSESLELLASGFKIPKESVWLYKPEEYTADDHPMISNAYNSPFFESQFTTSEFNLQSGFLTKERLTADAYYEATGFVRIPFSQGSNDSVEAIEEALQQRKEVVFDFMTKYRVLNRENPDSRLLEDCPDCSGDAHAVLIVGYDKSDPDPSKHYFIVKNSWGENHSTTRSDGFTYLSYDLVKNQGLRASYITGVAQPAPWTELGNIGRWDVNFDGWEGVLDIYHVPGVMQSVFDRRPDRLTDRRIGTFYPKTGGEFRVNGRMNGRHMTFYVDRNNPNARFDQLNGQRYEFDRIAGDDLSAGVFAESGNLYYGGLMIRQGSNAFNTPAVDREHTPQDMVGQWEMTYGTQSKRTVSFRIDSVELNGDITGSGGVVPITGSMALDESGNRILRLRGIINSTGYFEGYRYSWNGNLASGVLKFENGQKTGSAILKKVQ